jgi:glutathione S-transferase
LAKPPPGARIARMKLFHSPPSPYVRKVRICAAEIGVADRIEINTIALSPVDPHSGLNENNPLGKIPTLVLEDGTTLYDSRVICEYLDTLHDGERLFPPAGEARFSALRRQALADGILDAAVNARYESVLRPEAHRWPAWIEGQKGKVARALDQLEREARGLGDTVDIGPIAMAAALGYLDFRYASDQWRATRPKLAAWFDAFAERPSMRATVLTD